MEVFNNILLQTLSREIRITVILNLKGDCDVSDRFRSWITVIDFIVYEFRQVCHYHVTLAYHGNKK
jgi:activator of HSP90 ATPase